MKESCKRYGKFNLNHKYDYIIYNMSHVVSHFQTRLVRSRMKKSLRMDSKIELAEIQSSSFKSFLNRAWKSRGRDGTEQHFNAGEILSCLTVMTIEITILME